MLEMLGVWEDALVQYDELDAMFAQFVENHAAGGNPCHCSVVRAFAHGAMGCRIDPSWWNPLSYFSFQPVLHDWCNKGHGMCYPVCGMVHIKEPLLLIDKSSLCGGSGFPFSLSEWSLTIFLMPYNH